MIVVERFILENKAAVVTGGSRGRIDVLVKNVRVGHRRRARNFPDDGWRAVWDVNVEGVWRGRIIGKQMVEWGAAHNASKAAARQLTHHLAAERASFGVRANPPAPGYVKTEMSPVDRPRFQRYPRRRVSFRRKRTLCSAQREGHLKVGGGKSAWHTCLGFRGMRMPSRLEVCR